MKKDDFLITTSVNGKSWQLVWDHDDPLELDFPVYWELRQGEHGITLHHKTDGQSYAIGDDHLSGETLVIVPESKGEARHLTLQFKRLRKIKPAYHADPNTLKNIGAAEFYLSAGIREYLISFNALDKGGVTGKIEDDEVFTILHTQTGVQILPKRSGVRFKLLGQPSKPLTVGQTMTLTPTEAAGGAFIYGSYWWRLNKVPVPEMIDLDELDQEDTSNDLISLRALGKGVGIFFVATVLILRGLYYADLYKEHKAYKPPTITEIELKKPKIIPLPPEPPKIVKKEPPKKKEEPPKIIAKKEPPKKEKKKEPPKIAKKEPPKKKPPVKVAKVEHPKKVQPKKKPVPQVVAKAPAKKAPTHVAKAQPKAPAPAPKHVQAPAPVKVAKAVPPPPNPEVVKAQEIAKEKAQEKATLAKSLNFLSSGPSKNVNALTSTATGKTSRKYSETGSGDVPATNSELSKMANRNSDEGGSISTRGSRNIASNSGIAGGHGKGLNEVQGKVSLGALYGSGSGEDLGAAAGGGGMSVNGPGKLSDSAIEKTLAKYLQKFQYCYEKALLTDSSLAGTIQMQWTIEEGGAVSGAQVVHSAMNNKGLHQCMVRELSKIHFPSPTGGSVTVKKPFGFQSSAL